MTHRSSIYLGSDLEIDLSSLSAVAAPSEANEYLFGSGCIITSHQSGRHYWGKRFLAYVLVRPIPRQIWPNKYLDFGVPEVELNAGVAGSGLEGVMGWREIPEQRQPSLPIYGLSLPGVQFRLAFSSAGSLGMCGVKL